nr:MAG TPA: hypothetical protein [Caudoviricetes sp.]
MLFATSGAAQRRNAMLCSRFLAGIIYTNKKTSCLRSEL